jgi:hypothetical protein
MFLRARDDMEEMQEAKKVRRIFTPEQKFEILKDIERCKTIKEGLAISSSWRLEPPVRGHLTLTYHVFRICWDATFTIATNHQLSMFISKRSRENPRVGEEKEC